MDGLDVARINDDNAAYLITRARCVVAEFLSTLEERRELSEQEFKIILEGVKELQ